MRAQVKVNGRILGERGVLLGGERVWVKWDELLWPGKALLVSPCGGPDCLRISAVDGKPHDEGEAFFPDHFYGDLRDMDNDVVKGLRIHEMELHCCMDEGPPSIRANIAREPWFRSFHSDPADIPHWPRAWDIMETEIPMRLPKVSPPVGYLRHRGEGWVPMRELREALVGSLGDGADLQWDLQKKTLGNVSHGTICELNTRPCRTSIERWSTGLGNLRAVLYDLEPGCPIWGDPGKLSFLLMQRQGQPRNEETQGSLMIDLPKVSILVPAYPLS